MLAELDEKVIRLLERIVENTKGNEKRVPLDEVVMVSATTPWIVNYKERKNIYVYSQNDLTLTFEDFGSFILAANTWTLLNFLTGMRVYAKGQTANVPLFFRCADEDLSALGGAVGLAQANTGTKSSVASSASSVTILAANLGRRGAVVFNDSTQILYLDLSGGTASSSSYSVQVAANGYFELLPQATYTGLITGIWASANGNARVTEFT